MFTRSMSFVLAAVVLTGCAADAQEPEPTEVKVEEGAVAPKYDPRITLADLKAAGARCAGTTCELGGHLYECSGGGYCSVSKLN
jgi:hypothetical protein